MQALVNEGVRYIQIDAPRYSYYIDPKWREYIRDEMGVDPEQALDEAIRGRQRVPRRRAARRGRRSPSTSAAATTGASGTPRADTTRSPRSCSTSSTSIAFLLEYESERAGTFEPLRFVPRGKSVVLGLVSSKLPELESQDHLRRRIDEASRYVPLENLALSPQCGFASTMEGNLLTEDEQWRKLQLVVDTARAVWPDA